MNRRDVLRVLLNWSRSRNRSKRNRSKRRNRSKSGDRSWNRSWNLYGHRKSQRRGRESSNVGRARNRMNSSRVRRGDRFDLEREGIKKHSETSHKIRALFEDFVRLVVDSYTPVLWEDKVSSAIPTCIQSAFSYSVPV